jgi:hypothetical protein
MRDSLPARCHIFPAPGSGADAYKLRYDTGKMALIRETAGERYLQQAEFAGSQKFLGLVDPKLLQPLMGSYTRRLPKSPGEMPGR